MNKYFTKEVMQVANQHMKRCSTLLVIKEIKIKTTAREHYSPPEWLKLKRLAISRVGKEAK